MRYYRYDNDCSVAGIGTPTPIGDQLDEFFDRNEPVASRWKPIRLKVLDTRPKQAGDFPVFYNHPRLPVFSQRAWDVLSARIDCRWEALPIVHPSKKPYYFIHVMEVIDCLDHTRSEIEYYDDGRVAGINRYCLKTELLLGKHIFRMPNASRGELLVDDVFRQVVEGNELKGLEFHAIPRVDLPG